MHSIQTLFFVIICQFAQSKSFAQSKILKFEDFLHHRNVNLVKNSTEKNCPASFNNIFIQTQETHQYNTRSALNNLIDIPQSRTSFYGMHSIRSKSAIDLNTLQYELGLNFKDYSFKTLKKRFFNSFFVCSLPRVIYIYIYIYIYTMHMCMWIYVGVCICMYVFVFIYVYTHLKKT